MRGARPPRHPLEPRRPHSLGEQQGTEAAGITKDTTDPPDGRIDRDPTSGEPIGSLQEGAGQLVADKAPADDRCDRDAGLRYAVKMLNRYGITGVQDASVNEDDLKTYHRLDEAGELRCRSSARSGGSATRGSSRSTGSAAAERVLKGRIDAGTVKIMQDGVMENYTAVVLEPYKLKGRKDVRGIPMVAPELLKRAVTKLDAEGFQVHFHAIGDGAVRQALDAIEAARTANGDLGHRHHISHIQLIHPDDQPRFRKLGVIANFQPLWAYADDYITELTLPFVSKETASYMYPIASMEKSGAIVAFGSDWSVSTANPFEEMETAITRMGALDDTDKPWMPAERIGLPEALAAFTINAAYTNRNDRDAGSLEVGKRADLAVLDRNLFDIPPTELSDTKVLVTLFEGKAVHGSLGEL